jgi:hypothetical protein
MRLEVGSVESGQHAEAIGTIQRSDELGGKRKRRDDDAD